MNEPTPNTPQPHARVDVHTRAEPEPADGLRLLPWTSEGGNPCYLSTSGDAHSPVARVADRIEAEQLGIAAELLGEARVMLHARNWTAGQLHLLAVRLTESLTYVQRIAESRGARLGAVAVPDGVDDRDPDTGGL